MPLSYIYLDRERQCIVAADGCRAHIVRDGDYPIPLDAKTGCYIPIGNGSLGREYRMEWKDDAAYPPIWAALEFHCCSAVKRFRLMLDRKMLTEALRLMDGEDVVFLIPIPQSAVSETDETVSIENAIEIIGEIGDAAAHAVIMPIRALKNYVDESIVRRNSADGIPADGQTEQGGDDCDGSFIRRQSEADREGG